MTSAPSLLFTLEDAVLQTLRIFTIYVAVCRLYAARGVVDGHGLLHELLADVIEDLSGQKHNPQGSSSGLGGALAADSWLTASAFTSEVCRDNAVGMLDILMS